ncbi:MAG TPA: long-chain fatty acid--CoA ligase [Rubricoccaceae bacterium]
MPAVVPFETAPELARRLAARYAGTGKAALGFKSRETKEWTDVTWDELAARVRALAAFLVGRGVGPGDRVALLSENRPEWVVADLATQTVGAVTVALYPTVPVGQVVSILRDSGAAVVVASTGIQVRKAVGALAECPDLRLVVAMAAPKAGEGRDGPVVGWDDALAEGDRAADEVHDAVEARARAVTPDSLSALIYTSGTTGEPKGVMMTQRNLMANVHAVHARVDVFETDVHLSFLPLSHAFERTTGYTTVLSAGAQIVYAESTDTVAKNLPEVRPTLLVSVPRLFEKVYTAVQKSVAEGGPLKRHVFAWAVGVGKEVAARRRAGDGPGLALAAQHALARWLVFQTLHDRLGGAVRFAVSGGAALPQAVGEFFEAAGVHLIEGYGLSETAPVLAANPFEAPLVGTVGHVFPGVTLAVRDLHSGQIIGRLSGDDYPSDLTTGTGEILARGPSVMPGYWGKPAETAEVFDADGWFRTGDVGRFEDGYLRITDRIKHMIVSAGGKNVYPAPLEERLAASPLVDQVMVVGEGREFLTALVVPEADALRAEAAAQGWTLGDDPASQPEARALFEALVREQARRAASHEKVRGVRLVSDPFTVENGLLTPTMKLKRRAIEAQYAGLIDEMYAGAA